ncbi:MAG TPA: hypothetical protein DIU00_18575 [Phycisphaerales bacterium]|nr:hypothetical protein [Phycisphaerales bacterium]
MDSVERINALVGSKTFRRLRKETVEFAVKQRAHDDHTFLHRMAEVLRQPLPRLRRGLKKIINDTDFILDGRQDRA